MANLPIYSFIRFAYDPSLPPCIDDVFKRFSGLYPPHRRRSSKLPHF